MCKPKPVSPFCLFICLLHLGLPGGRSEGCTQLYYTLSNFKIRCDITAGSLHTSLRVTIKHAIQYATHTIYDNFLEYRNTKIYQK